MGYKLVLDKKQICTKLIRDDGDLCTGYKLQFYNNV